MAAMFRGQSLQERGVESTQGMLGILESTIVTSLQVLTKQHNVELVLH